MNRTKIIATLTAGAALMVPAALSAPSQARPRVPQQSASQTRPRVAQQPTAVAQITVARPYGRGETV